MRASFVGARARVDRARERDGHTFAAAEIEIVTEQRPLDARVRFGKTDEALAQLRRSAGLTRDEIDDCRGGMSGCPTDQPIERRSVMVEFQIGELRVEIA